MTRPCPWWEEDGANSEYRGGRAVVTLRGERLRLLQVLRQRVADLERWKARVQTTTLRPWNDGGFRGTPYPVTRWGGEVLVPAFVATEWVRGSVSAVVIQSGVRVQVWAAYRAGKSVEWVWGEVDGEQA